jgi:chemotaxis protein MotB
LPALRTRERHVELPDQIPQWQTIYCSLVLLLMVFFVMLAAWSTVESGKMAYARNIAERPKMDENDAAQIIRRYSELPGLKGIVTLEELNGGFKAIVEAPVLFESGKALVSSNAHALLNEIVQIALDSPLFITIEGHTDDTPIKTTEFPSNWELSTMRAVNVLRFLQSRGVPADRLSAVGYGEQRPLVENKTDDGRRKNRRIEIVFNREAS